MKKILFYSLFGLLMILGTVPAFAATGTFSCGPGYVLTDRSKIDGINAKECKKLWCLDLENNKRMGNGDKVVSGYRDVLTEITDGSDTVACYGERKWCAGEQEGRFDTSLGIYVRGADDGTTYKSSQKGSCFEWVLLSSTCNAGESAVLKDGKWTCVKAQSGGVNTIMKSSVRRTGNVGRIGR